MKLLHFALSEFDCHCGRPECDAKPMSEIFLAQLDKFREIWGRPLHVTSGRRCAVWNKKLNGAKDSQHLRGFAADILVYPEDRYNFVALAVAHGFNGIGVASSFIHLDARPLGVGDYRRLWTY